MTLETRLKQLEAIKPLTEQTFYTLKQEYGETQEQAIARYEAENGVKIAPDDKVWIVGFI